MDRPLLYILISIVFDVSRNEARRLITQGAVEFYGDTRKQKVVNPSDEIVFEDEAEITIKCGKLRWVRITRVKGGEIQWKRLDRR